jgi:RNA polymerase sigma-70 factor (ECF subfamily)
MPNPAASFEPYRRRLLGLAYRMLGSMADAEDAVQETYLRWHAADRGKVSDPRAFLMTTTTRICLDMLTSARARHEEYVGPWLPEPVLDTAALAPDSRTELAEDLSVALLLTLDRLSPLERAAFLLHDVFDFSFTEVATTLERSEAACRKLATRARAHVRALRPRGAAALPAGPGGIDAKHAQLNVRIRSGNPVGRSQCTDADARERRAHRDGRRRQGESGAERDRGRRSRGAVPG